MLLTKWMSKGLFTIDADASIQEAKDLLIKHQINILPVMKEGKLVEVVSKIDIKQASASDATVLDTFELKTLISDIKVKDIMSENPVTIPLNYSIEKVASTFLNNKISGATVVNNIGKQHF